MNRFSDRNKGIIYLLLAAFGYSVMSILIRFLNQEIPPISQVLGRYIFAFLFASILNLRNINNLKLSRNEIPFILFLGIIGYGLSNLVFTYSVLNTSINNALFIFSTYFVFINLFTVIFFNKEVTRKTLIASAMSFVGLIIFFGPSRIGQNFLGDSLAILASVMFALYSVFTNKVKSSPSTILFYNTLLGTITVGILAIIYESQFYLSGDFSKLSLSTILLLVLFGFDNFISWYFTTKGFKLINPSIASLILLLEPILGVIFATIIFKEIPTIFGIIGGLLIISAAILAIFSRK